MNKFFNLSPECFLVVGEKRSAIYNLDSGELVSLGEAQTNAMLLAESKKETSDAKGAEVYQYLAERGWGFFSSKPVFVDKVRPMNVFGERRIWLQKPQFIMALLQVTDRCGKTCVDCGKTFCPICFSDPRTEEKQLSPEQWIKIIDNIILAGCKNIMFTGGECLLYDGLEQLLEHALLAGAEVCVHTSGQLPTEKLSKNIKLSVLVNRDSDLQQVVHNLRGRKKVSLILQDIDPAGVAPHMDKAWELRMAGSGEPMKGKRQLDKTKMDDFFYKKLKDPCLNGKMFVLSDGNVVPCFQGRSVKIGNLAEEDCGGVYRKLIVDFWYAPMEQRTKDKKCRLCEFKYACPTCRFSNPDVFCQYDPLPCYAHLYDEM